MIRFDLNGDGMVVEVSDVGFLKLLVILVRSYMDLAEKYIQNHISGLADFDGKFYDRSLLQIQSQFITIDKVLLDEQLINNLHSLLEYLQELESNDEKIVYEYARFLDLIHPVEGIKRKQVKSLVLKQRMQSKPLPENVLILAKESGSFLPLINHLGKEIEERINTLLQTKA